MPPPPPTVVFPTTDPDPLEGDAGDAVEEVEEEDANEEDGVTRVKEPPPPGFRVTGEDRE